MTPRREITVTVVLVDESDHYDDVILALALDTAMADAVLAFVSRYDLAPSTAGVGIRVHVGCVQSNSVVGEGEQP